MTIERVIVRHCTGTLYRFDNESEIADITPKLILEIVRHHSDHIIDWTFLAPFNGLPGYIGFKVRDDEKDAQTLDNIV